jgi:hypothetical protein
MGCRLLEENLGQTNHLGLRTHLGGLGFELVAGHRRNIGSIVQSPA